MHIHFYLFTNHILLLLSLLGLEASRAYGAPIRRGGTVIPDSIFWLKGSVRREGTYLNPIKVCKIGRGCVTPRDLLGFISTPFNDLEGLIFESAS